MLRTRFTEMFGVTHRIVQGDMMCAAGCVALETGDLAAGLVWAGQVQRLIHDIPTCRELIDRIMAQAETIIQARLPLLVQP